MTKTLADGRTVTVAWVNPPVALHCNYTATFENYDGAPDSPTRHDIGWGTTPDEAVADLLEQVG